MEEHEVFRSVRKRFLVNVYKKCVRRIRVRSHLTVWSHTEDEVAEWLRRWTANPMCSARVGSNPILVDLFCPMRLKRFSQHKT